MAEHQSTEYGPESSAEELEVLRARASYIGDGIIHYREIPNYNAFTFEIVFGRVAELAREHDARKLIVDLAEVERRPDAQARASILAGVRGVEKLEHMVVVTGHRLLFNVALKFIVSKALGITTSAYGTLDAALEALRDD